ncbi:MAG: hypothetical protein AB1585_16080 [Thermodesulfobacteriota bacterium]
MEGGIKEGPEDQIITNANSQCMTGSLSREVIEDPWLSGLVRHWIACQMIEVPSKKDEVYRLTGNGSWFIQSMIQEIERQEAG